MTAIMRLTVREWFNRKMGLTMCVLTVVLPTMLILPNQIHRDAAGVFHGGKGAIPAGILAQTAFEVTMVLSAQIWSFLAAISAAMLFTSLLERGWAEVIFTKAQRRWSFLVTRFLAIVTAYATSVTLMLLILVAYYGRAGSAVIPGGLWKSVLLLTISFSALVAIAALAALPRSGMALPIFAVFLQTILSGVFAQRESINRLLSSELARKAITASYWILPKHTELERWSRTNIGTAPALLNTSQLWTTVAFTVGVMAISVLWLERKQL